MSTRGPTAGKDQPSHLPLTELPGSGDDLRWMAEALALAERAGARGEVPVAALVVHRGKVVGRGYNLRETLQDPTAHAEIVALREAARTIGYWRLLDTTLYVTLEPCPMCAGALINARVPRLVFGCRDPKAGAVRSLYHICEDERLNHRLEVVEGVLGDRCSRVLKDFFAAKRHTRKGKRAGEPSPPVAQNPR